MSAFPSRPSRAVLAVLLLLSAAAGACSTAPPLADRPDEARAARRQAAVASAEPAATEVGLATLRRGGSATDAAVATALALAVVMPQAGNLGGGGFAVVRAGATIAALDFRETAPAAATRDMFLDASGAPRPGASLIGPLAAGVPGSPAGLHALHRRFGRLPWADVVAPAVRLAEGGFSVTPRLREAILAERDLLARFPETAAAWLPGGLPPEAGRTVRLPVLGATLRAYAARGPEAIVTGPVAAAVEAVARRHGGILTAADLASYRPVWREPLRFAAFGWEFASMPLPSSGGLIMAQGLAILERLGWQRSAPGGADRAHLLAETWRRAFADRFVLGDPARTKAAEIDLLDPTWIVARAAGIAPDRATPSAQVLPWPGREEESAVPRAAATTHLSVVDADGSMVALTTTLNGWFGSGLLVPGAGFILNNEMDDFATAPGRPNMFQLIQGEANAVAPGARMLSSMAPTIAWRGDDALALGSPNGSRIPTAVTQVLLAVIVDGAALADAVARPRFHHQWLPDEIVAESGALPPAVAAELERRGHRIRIADGGLGEIDAVRRASSAAVEAVADARGPGGAGVTAAGARTSGAKAARPGE